MDVGVGGISTLLPEPELALLLLESPLVQAERPLEGPLALLGRLLGRPGHRSLALPPVGGGAQASQDETPAHVQDALAPTPTSSGPDAAPHEPSKSAFCVFFRSLE